MASDYRQFERMKFRFTFGWKLFIIVEPYLHFHRSMFRNPEHWRMSSCTSHEGMCLFFFVIPVKYWDLLWNINSSCLFYLNVIPFLSINQYSLVHSSEATYRTVWQCWCVVTIPQDLFYYFYYYSFHYYCTRCLVEKTIDNGNITDICYSVFITNDIISTHRLLPSPWWRSINWLPAWEMFISLSSRY